MAQQPFSNFRTELFRQIDPDDEDATFRRLVDLFYAFNPVRNFRDSQNQQIDSLADLGLLYCRSESAFSNKQLNIERLKFLEKIGRNDLQKLKYVPFVFEIFKDNAESHIELMDITFDVKRNYRVSYKFYKSLKNFHTTVLRTISRHVRTRLRFIILEEDSLRVLSRLRTILFNRYVINTIFENSVQIMSPKSK